MNFRTEILPLKHLAGMRMRTSLVNDKTRELFQRFMPRRHEIGKANPDIFCVQIYDASYSFSNFDPNAEFEKWAAVEVDNSGGLPDEIETLDLPGGLYAVFDHKGGPATAPESFGFIFGTWLPASDYALDHRPHFEIIGEKYGDGGPDSEEEIWIPIRVK